MTSILYFLIKLNEMSEIILATGSSYRQEIFKNLEILFKAEKSDIDENFSDRPSDPKKLVLELAKRKAEAVASKNKTGIVIGFDSVMFANGEILEKADTKKNAFEMVKKLSGNKACFLTGIYIINIDKNKILKKVVSTVVYFRKFFDWEIKKYLEQDEKYNTYVGGFNALKYYSATFLKNISGSFYNMCGLPLEVIVEMLNKIEK